MTERHACPLCDFSRAADQVAVLDPHCPDCGGTLRPAAAPAAPAREPLAGLGDRRWLERLLLGLLVAPVVVAATKIGWSAAGPAAAAAGLLVAVLSAYVALAPASRQR